MNLTEFKERVDDLQDITTLKKNKVMIRNCVDGNMYEIDDFALALYGYESIIIIDIKPEEK